MRDPRGQTRRNVRVAIDTGAGAFAHPATPRAGSSGGKRPGANSARSTRCAAPSRINSLIASPVAGALSMPQTLWPAATQAPSIPATRHGADERKAVLGDRPEARLPRFDRRRGERRRDIPTQPFEPCVRSLIRCNIGRIDRHRPGGRDRAHPDDR